MSALKQTWSVFVVSTSLFLACSLFAASASRNRYSVEGKLWRAKGKPAEISGVLTVIAYDDFQHNIHRHFNFVDGVIKRNGRTGRKQRFKLELQGHLPGDVQTGSVIQA